MSRTADFQISTWSDPWVQHLKPYEKLLFVYLWTNSHREISGLYSISPKTIADETSIPEEQVIAVMGNLYPKVLYDAKTYLVFIVNMVKHQFMRGEVLSSAIRHGIRKAIRANVTRGHPFIKAFCEAYPSVMTVEEYPFGEISEFEAPTSPEEKVRRREGKPTAYTENPQYMMFWAAYPRKDTGPKGPYKYWPHPMPNELFTTIMAKLTEFKATEQWRDVKKVPMATTWLNQRRWEGHVIHDTPQGNLLPPPPGKYANLGARVETDG